MGKVLIIKEIPPFTPLARFVAGFFKKILILDNSLFTFSDQREDNLKLKKNLLQFNPDFEVDILDPVEGLPERFNANKESISYITSCIDPFRQEKDFNFFYYGFLGRHFQPTIAKGIYLEKILKKKNIKSFFVLSFFSKKSWFRFDAFPLFV